MPIDSPRFAAAIASFDAANADDPDKITIGGQTLASQVLYARRMTDWLSRLEPAASEPLKLAARCQHIRRWQIPRDRYPRTRAGYHQWRTTLYRFHADQAEQILRSVGYGQTTIDRVRSLVMKEHLKSDSEAQLLEDVICLVFLENYFSPFARQHSQEKLIAILRKTWLKMSPRGQAAALQLPLAAEDRQLIEQALAKSPPGGS